MTPRIGSLFSGYGGLEMGVQSVLGGDVVWHCENDPAASKVLAHHWPDVPNLGDVTAVNWSQVEPVDVLTGGFPCQPVSCAGKRIGTSDARWLFDEIVRALGGMGTRPRLCVFENVPGLLTANRGDAMARVVHGLASVGYVGQWRVVQASAAGAPHGRARVFIVAGSPADSDESRLQRCQSTERQDVLTRGATPDADSDDDRETLEGVDRQSTQTGSGSEQVRTTGSVSDVDWAQYGRAVHRWEHVLGRVAPSPTEPSIKGQLRLSPAFVEWLMGLPSGWVTDVPGVSRKTQLKVLGNGVVPQQAAMALELLLPSKVAA